MKISKLSLAALWVVAVFHGHVRAHEFWIAPVANPQAVGSIVRLSLWVGEQFTGELVGWSKAQTVGLRLVSSAGLRDIAQQVPVTPVADLPISLAELGTYLVAYESQPNTITLSADRFHAYLHDEGLDFIKAQRDAAGQAKLPGRERYRRYVKTLLAVQGSPAGASARPVHAESLGQRLELIPVNNPLDMSPGEALRVQVLFEGKPLPGALLKAWHKADGQTTIVRVTTGPDGSATVNLPYPGAWMVSAVHMVRVVGVKGLDWDSMWGNLSFTVHAKN